MLWHRFELDTGVRAWDHFKAKDRGPLASLTSPFT